MKFSIISAIWEIVAILYEPFLGEVIVKWVAELILGFFSLAFTLLVVSVTLMKNRSLLLPVVESSSFFPFFKNIHLLGKLVKLKIVIFFAGGVWWTVLLSRSRYMMEIFESASFGKET